MRSYLIRNLNRINKIRLFEDVIANLTGVIVGGLITVYFGFLIYEKQEFSEKKSQQLQISGLKFGIYKEFLYIYGDASKVSNLKVGDIYLINTYVSTLNVLGDKIVVDKLITLYRNLLAKGCKKDGKSVFCHSLVGELESKERKQYYNDLELIIEAMNQSVAVDKIEVKFADFEKSSK